MNVDIGAEAALFPEKEYIYGIFFAMYSMVYTVSRFRTYCKTKNSQLVLVEQGYKNSTCA